MGTPYLLELPSSPTFSSDRRWSSAIMIGHPSPTTTYRRVAALLTWMVVLATSALGSADLAQKGRAFDARVARELDAKNPEAARLLAEADAARERGEAEASVPLYERIRKLEPTFAHAVRRLCSAELELG